MKIKKLILTILGVGMVYSISTPVITAYASETPLVANIETSNVAYDLKMFYGGNDWQSYNLNSLEPNSNKDKDLNYKFYLAKPVETSLYLYLYYNTSNTNILLDSTFKISTSKTQNSTTGVFTENFKTYTARYINSYGGRFHKFCIDSIIANEKSYRFYIENCLINYQSASGLKSNSGAKPINDEFIFADNDNGDIVSYYFKDDYVRIIDAEVKALIQKTTDGWHEDFYYFFTSDHEIDELIEVQYEYDYITYQDESFSGRGGVCVPNVLQAVCYTPTIYTGLKKDANKVIYENTFHKVASIKMGTTTATAVTSNPYLNWWYVKTKYELQNIQDCINTSNLSGKEQQDFLNIINAVQKERTNAKKPKYQWTFKVTSDTRTSNVVRRDVKDGWDWLLGSGAYSITTAHEPNDTLVTWLHFRTDNQEFKLNAFDIPRATTGAYVQYVKLDTLLDVVRDNFNSLWDSILSGLNSIYPILAIILTIILLILFFPVIKGAFGLIGLFINKGVKKAKRKEKKQEKEYKRRE